MSIKYYDWSKFQANTRPNKVAIRELDNNKIYTYGEIRGLQSLQLTSRALV